jgi:hypothetical protein
MTGVELVPYAEKHAPFVVGTFADRLLAHPNVWHGKPVREHKKVLRQVLRHPAAGAIVAIPRGYPDDFVGWAAAFEGVLVFAFVRENLRRLGYARGMLAALGLDAPIPVAYWTRDCSLMAAGGKPLFFDVPALDRLSSLVH